MTFNSTSSNSLRLVLTPLATNTAAVTGDSAVRILARATFSTLTKSIICLPSPKTNGGEPAATSRRTNAGRLRWIEQSSIMSSRLEIRSSSLYNLLASALVIGGVGKAS